MVGHIHILKKLFFLVFLGLSNEGGDFISLLFALHRIVYTVGHCVLDLEELKTKAGGPLTVEGLHLLLLEEGGSEELLTPVGCMCVLSGIPGIQNVFILNDILIVTCAVECPDLELVQTVIDEWHVGIGRVGVQRLTLNIVEVQLHIVILSWDHRSITNCCAILSIEGLQTLPIVILHEANIINIIVEIWVFLDALIESLEWVIEVWLLNDTMHDGVESHVNTSVDLSVVVLHLIVVDP